MQGEWPKRHVGKVGEVLYQALEREDGYYVREHRGHWKRGGWCGPFSTKAAAHRACESHARTGFYGEVRGGD